MDLEILPWCIVGSIRENVSALDLQYLQTLRRCHDARGADLLERQQPAQVAGDEVIGLGRLEELLDPVVAACPAEFHELPR